MASTQHGWMDGCALRSVGMTPLKGLFIGLLSLHLAVFNRYTGDAEDIDVVQGESLDHNDGPMVEKKSQGNSCSCRR